MCYGWVNSQHMLVPHVSVCMHPVLFAFLLVTITYLKLLVLGTKKQHEFPEFLSLVTCKIIVNICINIYVTSFFAIHPGTVMLLHSQTNISFTSLLKPCFSSNTNVR